MSNYHELIEKAPIIGIGEKVVHLSDFVNDIMFSKDERLNKSLALEDIEVVIDFINKYLKIEEELGTSLDILFKAMKDGFYYIENGTHEIKFSGNYKELDNSHSLANYIWVNNGNFEFLIRQPHFGLTQRDFKDYGKTWALTKEELE